MGDLKDRLKILRRKLGISQKEMARELGVPFTLISKYECGKIKPGADMLSKIALRYNVNLNWLLTGQGNIFVEPDDSTNFSDPLIPFSSEEDYLILKKLSESPVIKEFVVKLIKARSGDKKALSEIREMLKGLLMLL
jgi:transcriptional regulator with XRE-family HTH domain